MSDLGWSDEAAREAFAKVGLGTMEELAACRFGELVTTARTRWLRNLEIAGRHWFVKVQDLRGHVLPPARWPSYLVKGSPVAREGRSLAVLRALGIKVPDVVAEGQERGFLFPRLAALVTRELEGYVDLALWLAGRPSTAAANRAMNAAEALLARLHAEGFVALGFKYRNLLVPVEGLDAGRPLAVIDQPDLRRSRSERLRAKDRDILARDRQRFGQLDRA